MYDREHDGGNMATHIAGFAVSLCLFPTIHCRMGVGAPLWAKVVMYAVALLIASLYAANIGLRIYDRIDRKRKGLD